MQVMDDFNRDCLKTHNELRELHGCPPLEFDEDLVDYAQKWAEYLAAIGQMEHSPESESVIGENISMKICSEVAQFSGTEVSDEWYGQIHHYNFDEENQLKCGHFSQLVWKSTEKAGFGRAICEDGRVFVVGQYLPPGNVMNRWRENVPTPLNGKIFRRKVSSSSSEDVTFNDPHFKAPFQSGDHQLHSSLDMKDSSDVHDTLVGRSTKSRITNGMVTNTVTETYETPEGDRYVINTEFQEPITNGVPNGHGKLGKHSSSSQSKSRQESFRTREKRMARRLPKLPDVPIEEFRADVLEAHNFYRASHGAPELYENHSLDDMAQAWAEFLMQGNSKTKCHFTYQDEPLGENTLVKLNFGAKLKGKELVDLWYEEGADYPYSMDPKSQLRKCGCFSQMLWNESEMLGVGRATDEDGHTWFVCLYYPAGNVRQRFLENVFPRQL